jgi:Mn-dependent DtxR family transcriptional regulator
MHRDLVRFIERMGLLWETEGLPRIAGRMYGLALVSPSPKSLDQFADELKVSKPSVSNDARMLHKLGLIEKVSLPGDRRDYYQVTRDSMERGLETRVVRLRAFHEAIVAAQALPIVDADVEARLAAHAVAHLAVIDALDGVIARLKKRQSPSARSSRS